MSSVDFTQADLVAWDKDSFIMMKETLLLITTSSMAQITFSHSRLVLTTRKNI